MKTHTYNIYVLSLLMFIANGIYAQRNLQKARDLKNNFEYAQAIIYFNNYFSNNTPTAENAREVAESYFKINDTRNAELWLSKVINSESKSASDILNYAHILRTNGKYSEAVEQYRAYMQIKPDEKNSVKKWIDASENALRWMEEPSYFQVENALVFNTENADFGLMPFKDGFVLTSDRKAKAGEDIYGWTGRPYLKMFYFSDVDFDNNTAKKAVIGDLNNDFHNGPASFDSQSNTIYFTRTKQVRVRKNPMNTDPTSWVDNAPKNELVSRLEIYSASYENGSWSKIKPFEYNNTDVYSVGHPALSPCGKIMYFASDMQGGLGGTDIYYTTLNDDGNWSAPKNAGNTINTEGNEVFPYMDKNGTLFFSSNGHPGMGGLDIFQATGSFNKWTNPVNLKYPINSPKDDFSIFFTHTDKSGFLSSNREGGKGDDDIYTFELMPPKNLTIVAITKENMGNELALLSNVNIDLKTSQKKISLKTDENGYLFIPSDCDESYSFTASKEGYFSETSSLLTKCRTYNDTIFVELVLDKYVVGKTFAIKNIFYDFDKWNIRADAKPELDHIVQVLIENPQINIELGSHTDSRGTHRYNERLSQRRAESAVAYIVSRGIETSRITAKGYGENELVNECADGVRCNEEQHQMNRRTEFKVTSLNY